MKRPDTIRRGGRVAPALSMFLMSIAAGASPAFSQTAAPTAPAMASPATPPVVTPPAAPPVTAPLTPATPMPGAVPPLMTPAASGATPLASGARSLTLDEAVALALSNNSSVLLARERLRKAAEQITQATAQAYPSVRIDVGDTLSSTRGFGSGVAGGSSSAVTLPGGGVIPNITDQGGGTVQTFVGGGGGGNATGGSTGSGLNGSTTTTTTTPSSSSPSSTGAGAVNTGPSSGGTIGGGGTSGTGTSGTGTSTGTGGASSHLLQQLSDQTKAPGAVAHDTTTGTGTGTTISNNGSQGKYNTYGARLSVTQGVDIFRLVPAAEDVLRRTRDFYQTDLDRVSNEVALSVKNSFFTLLRDQENIRVQQEQVTADTENVRIAQAKFGAGTVAQYDVLTAQTTLSTAQQALYKAQNQVNIDQANLNAGLGTAPDAETALDTASLPVPNETFDLPTATQTAYAKRPEMIQADNNITIAEKLIKLAGATLKPSLSLTGSAGYSGVISPGSKHDTYSIAADLGFPLYDGGTTKSKVRSAEIDLETQKITKAQLQQNVAIEVRQAYLNIENAKARLASAAQGEATAREAVRLANVRYQNGISAFIEVTNAQTQLVTAENDRLSAFYDYQTSRAQLVRAEGGR